MDVKNGNEVILKKFLSKEKIWYSQTKECEYVIDSMIQLTEVVSGIRKKVQRRAFFKDDKYQNTIFILMKQYITDKDKWKNTFQGDKLLEYYVGTDEVSYQRDPEQIRVVFTNEGTHTWTGPYIVFKGVYKLESIDEENKVITYTRISDKFELK